MENVATKNTFVVQIRAQNSFLIKANQPCFSTLFIQNSVLYAVKNRAFASMNVLCLRENYIYLRDIKY